MLEPESVNILQELKEKYQESHAKLIARALAVLEESFTCERNERPQMFTCKPIENQSVVDPDRNRPCNETKVSNTSPAIYLFFKEIKEKLEQGATVTALKQEIITAMKEMRTMGYDSSQIADQLYEERIKTSKGNERWEAGTIRNWWK